MFSDQSAFILNGSLTGVAYGSRVVFACEWAASWLMSVELHFRGSLCDSWRRLAPLH
jgi:hypothetical protein